MRIAVIDKCPSKVNYSKHFGFEVETYHLASTKVQRLKKADIDLGLNHSEFDWVILIGSEAAKLFTKVTAVSNYTGKRVEAKDGSYKNYLISISPAMLFMKPEMKPVFEQTVKEINDHINGTTKKKASVDYAPLQSTNAINEYLQLVLRLPVDEYPVIALDTEDSGLYARKCWMLGVSVSHKTHQGVYIDADYMDEVSYTLLQGIVNTPNRDIVLHNAKFDMHMLGYHLKLDFTKAFLEKRLHDTMVMHYVLDERQGTHGLKALAMKYTDMGDYDFELDEFKKTYCKEHGMKQEEFSYDLIPFDVMWPYACLNKDAKVYLEDGSRVDISQLVKEQYSGKVLSYNEKTGKVEPRQVTGWIKNPHKSGKWKKVEYYYQPRGLQWSKGSLMGPAFTPDHRILTDKGYVEIKDIVAGQHKIATNERQYTKDTLALLMGCLMGDGSLHSRNGKGAEFDFSQASKHGYFFDLVASAFGGKVTKWSKLNSKGLRLSTGCSHQLTDLYHTLDFLEGTQHQKVCINSKSIPLMTELSLAAWYMSDGSLAENTPRIWRRSVSNNLEEQKAILDWLKSLGLDAHYHDDGLNNQFFVIDSKEKFFRMMAQYIAGDMNYKLPKEYQNEATKDLRLGYSSNIYFAEVKSIVDWEAPASRRGYKTSYCLDVQGNHNFLTDIGFVHNCGDTDATIRLYHKFLPLIRKNQKLNWLYENLLMPATVFLYRMEERGLPISEKRLDAANLYLNMKLYSLEQKLYSYEDIQKCEAQLGKKFNPNSPQQLRTLLFDVIGLSPTGIMTDTGADSTDKEVLAQLGKIHEIPKLLLEIRQTTKLINSFIVKLKDNIDKDSRIRTNFLCTSTTSGRLSSSGTFNAQQLPRDNPIIKGCVVARPGYKIIAYDLTTAEVYFAAVLSGDRNLQQVFINMTNEPEKYADFHSTIAHMVFHLPCEPNEVKKSFSAMRQAAKAITFGIMYGSGPAKVAESVNEALLAQSIATGEPFVPCSIEDAKGHISAYFKMFPQLKRWIDASHDQIRQCGYIYNFFGRKRRLRNFQSSDKGVVAGEVRSGFNAIIQSASSDSLLIGVMNADNEILDKGMDAQIFGLVHDSIVAEVREDLVEEYIEVLIRNVQGQKYNGWDDKPLEIPGCPIGIDNDSQAGGSRDYSCGKMDKAYPFIAAYDSPEMQKEISVVLEQLKQGEEIDHDNKIHSAIAKNAQMCLEAMQDIGLAA